MSWINEYVNQFQYGYPEWDTIMSDFTGIGRSDRGRQLARREYEAVQRQSVHRPSDTVDTVDIYPVDEEGTEVEMRQMPFHIRRGSLTIAQLLSGRVTMGVDQVVLRASVDQMIAGITHAQTQVLTPTQYWELRHQLMTLREERRRHNPRLHHTEGSQLTGLRGELRLDAQGNPRAGSQQLTGLRGEIRMAEDSGLRLTDALQRVGQEAKKLGAALTTEDLRVIDYGPDAGTTEMWLKGKIVTMTVDGIYYNRYADQGEPGYSQAPSAQPLFQLKEAYHGTGFIYDEFGYIDGGTVQWDGPFIWTNESGQPMGSMFDLKYDELADDRTVGMYC
jgi:hypothetical protein